MSSTAFYIFFVISIMYYVIEVQAKTMSPFKEELILAQLVYRHGDRNPVTFCPTDSYANPAYWPDGLGQLTNIGKRQQFQLGQFFRRRYRYGLLNGLNYSPELVYIQSTGVDRTLMSASANLAGLFPPAGTEVWHENIAWQPIPVHSMPTWMDGMLAAEADCPRHLSEFNKVFDSAEIRALNKRFKPLYDYLSIHSGRKVQTLYDVENLHNTLYIESIRNLTLPEWTRKVYPGGEMEWITSFSFKLRTYTKEMAKLKAGYFVRDVFKRAQDKAAGNKWLTQKLWMYSAHDKTIADILNALGLFNMHIPPYCSCIMFELYKVKNDFNMKIFYRNTTAETMEPMYIPNCGTSCPLNKLFELYQDIIPRHDLETECRISK